MGDGNDKNNQKEVIGLRCHIVYHVVVTNNQMEVLGLRCAIVEPVNVQDEEV
jgi:hypothetical protein